MSCISYHRRIIEDIIPHDALLFHTKKISFDCLQGSFNPHSYENNIKLNSVRSPETVEVPFRYLNNAIGDNMILSPIWSVIKIRI